MTATFVDRDLATRSTLQRWAPRRPLGKLGSQERQACHRHIIASQKQCALSWGSLEQTHRTIERTRAWLAASRSADPTWGEVVCQDA